MYSTQFISLFGYVLYMVHPSLPKRKDRRKKGSQLAAAYTPQKRTKFASNTTVQNRPNVNLVFLQNPKNGGSTIFFFFLP